MLEDEKGCFAACITALIVNLDVQAPYWMTYDFPIQIRHRLNKRWGTNYKGQAQKW